jgi:membrane-bound lytic murein transglycosylase D
VKNPFLLLFSLSLMISLSACAGLFNTKSLTNSKPLASTEPENSELTEPNDSQGEDRLFCDLESEEPYTSENWRNLQLWDRIQHGYRIPSQTLSKFEKELNWYKKHPEYIERVAHRGSPYLFYITNELEKRGMPLEIALLPIVESAFDPFAYSPGRASGMWQIIPSTGRSLGLKQNWWYDGRRDVVASTQAALDYLESLHKRFNGDWLLALAAYNSGGGTVSKAIKRNKKQNKATDFWNLRLPKETEGYVPRLLALAELFSNPTQHGLSLPELTNAPYFAEVALPYQIDLAQAASLAGVSMEDLYKLNPGFNRWATDPAGPHRMLVPLQSAQSFAQKLKQVPETQRVRWVRHVIGEGETLSHIAKKYDVNITALQEVNELKDSRIRAGKTLMVPSALKGAKFYSHAAEQRRIKTQNAYAKSGKTKVVYRVKHGDSLWSIAKKYKTRSAKIAKWNGIAPKDTLSIGQKLVIWTTPSPTLASPYNDPVVRKLSYRVRSGDSLARIAQKFRVHILDIVRWNGIDQGKYLQPGQALTLFVNIKS